MVYGATDSEIAEATDLRVPTDAVKTYNSGHISAGGTAASDPTVQMKIKLRIIDAILDVQRCIDRFNQFTGNILRRSNYRSTHALQVHMDCKALQAAQTTVRNQRRW